MRRRPDEGVWSIPPEELIGTPVADGIRVTALPFPTPLRFSFSYLVETTGGLIVVDLGWDTDDSWQRFQDGVSRAGWTTADIAGVVITHAHPDHYGLAARVRQSSSAWIGMHPAERPALTLTEAEGTQRVGAMAQWLQRCGAPKDEVELLHAESAELIAHFPGVAPDVDLDDRTALPGTGGSLVPVHTAGHTPGHLCFHDRDRGVVFTGDHLLPRITPNISKRPTSDPDPLADFAQSLRTIEDLDAGARLTALPGHEWGFEQVGDRAREIDGHHVARLAEMQAAVERGRATVWEVAEAVEWARPFSSLSARARRSAIGETHSHLQRLYATGRIAWDDGATEFWTPAEHRAPEEGTGPAEPTTRRLLG